MKTLSLSVIAWLLLAHLALAEQDTETSQTGLKPAGQPATLQQLALTCAVIAVICKLFGVGKKPVKPIKKPSLAEQLIEAVGPELHTTSDGMRFGTALLAEQADVKIYGSVSIIDASAIRAQEQAKAKKARKRYLLLAILIGFLAYCLGYLAS